MKNSILPLLLFIFSISFSEAQQIVFVDPLASGDQSGSSWSNAYTNLIDAVNGATAGSEIWVSNRAPLYVTKTQTQADAIIIDKDLQFYGGFNGTETAINQRNILSPSPSIATGEIGSSSTTSDNSYNAFVIQSNVLIDGFIFNFFNSGFDDLPHYGVIEANTNSQVYLLQTAFSHNEGHFFNGVCLSAFKNAVVNADYIALVDNATDGSLITRSDNAEININNSVISNNGIVGNVASFIFYSLRNGSPGQILNEEILLNVENTSFSGNALSIAYSYFGSNSFKNCSFDLEETYQYSLNLFGDSSSCLIDGCSFTGSYQTTLIYTNGLKNFTFSNSTFDNPLSNDEDFFNINAANIYFFNSDFNKLNGSVPFRIAASGKVTIKECDFTNGEASSYYLYVLGKTFTNESNRFENLESPLGNYFSCDSLFFRKCVFKNIVGTYNFTPFLGIGYAEVDSCEFSGLSHTYGMFIADRKLVFKNSTIRNSTMLGNNTGAPYIFGNWGGDVKATNNQFEEISAHGNMISNNGTMFLFGNTFKLITTSKPFFQNSKELKVYNCNFSDLTMPFAHHDSSYTGNPTLMHFELINSIVYSSNDTVLWNKVIANNYTQAISNCFTNNNNLNGTTITKDFTTPYADLYAESSHPDLTDKGLPLLAAIVPLKDILGDPRIVNGVIDIGAIEFSGQLSSLKKKSRSNLIKCYPNPGSDLVQVEVKSKSTLEVYKLDGTKVMSFRLDEGVNNVQLANLEEGMYVFCLSSEMDLQQFLFVKQ